MQSRSRTALAIFLVFQGLYALTASGNAFRVPDEFEVYFQAEHLVDAGDLSVPQTLAIRQPVVVNGEVVGTEPIFFGKVGRDGKPYAPYGPLAAFLILPHHLLARAVAFVAGVPRASGIPWTFLVGGLTALSSTTAAALAVVAFYHAALAAGARPASATSWSLVLGGATVLWPYASTLYAEAWQAAAFTGAAALLLNARTNPIRASRNVWLAAALLAIAVLTKPTSILFTPGFLAAAALDRERPLADRAKLLAALASGIGAAALIHLAWNAYRFGDAFDFGYAWGEMIPQQPVRTFALADVPRGLMVLLASPGKSLFFWAPATLLSIFAVRGFYARQRAAAIGIAVSFGLGLLAFAAYAFPEGGYANGPRHLVPIVPLLLLPAAAAPVETPRAALGVCGAIGVVMAVMALTVSFFEDQGLGGDLRAGARTVYYERIDPAPGRPWNRYRMDYVPFVAALGSPGWSHAPVLGQGPDFFPLHLAQLRRINRNAAVVPAWFMYAWPVVCLAVLVAGAAFLRGRAT
jgi:hypothetical protein